MNVKQSRPRGLLVFQYGGGDGGGIFDTNLIPFLMEIALKNSS